MEFKFRNLAVLCLLLVPSAQFCWRNREMPNFGRFHDDGLIFTSAKSLADGNGYRIESLPSSPHQTKYPPLYPLYLSLVWDLDPHFPGNLPLAMLFNWLILAAMMVLSWVLFDQWGYSYRRKILLTALVSISPYVLVLGTSILSEIFFTCFVLCTMLLVRREGTAAILLAGCAAACAYYTRTAGITLMASVPLFLIWKREWRRLLLFSSIAIPAVAGWAWWTATHHPLSSDPVILYYTDYLNYQFQNVDRSNFLILFWNNIDQILYGMGSLIVPKVIELLPLKILTQVIGIAMIAGTVRMAKKNIGIEYAFFGAVSIGLLLVWHGPPTERLVVPLYPLLIAGFVTELEHLAGMVRASFRHKDVSQRVAGGMIGAVAGAVVFAALGLQLYLAFAPAGNSESAEQSYLADRRAAYQWISINLPGDAKVFSYDDPLLYLYTGRQGSSLPLPIRWWYPEKDHRKMVDAFRDLGSFCRSHGMQFVYVTSQDLSREADDDDRKAVAKLVRADPTLSVVYTAQAGTVYRVAP